MSDTLSKVSPSATAGLAEEIMAKEARLRCAVEAGAYGPIIDAWTRELEVLRSRSPSSPLRESRSEVKRRVAMQGGTMDEAFEEIKRVESPRSPSATRVESTQPDLTIYMDQKPFSVLEQYRQQGFTELPSTPTLSGAQILALGGRDACSQLFLENPDQHKADMLIPVWNAVVLADGMQFYGLPPTIFASRAQSRTDEEFGKLLDVWANALVRFAALMTQDNSKRANTARDAIRGYVSRLQSENERLTRFETYVCQVIAMGNQTDLTVESLPR